MSDYECHITMKGERKRCEDVVKRIGFNWTFSCIDQDPVLGNDIFCYATNHFPSEEEAQSGIRLAYRDLRSLGMNILRSKIEHVVFDVRYPDVTRK